MYDRFFLKTLESKTLLHSPFRKAQDNAAPAIEAESPAQNFA